MTRHVVLIGLSGAGKSTAGREAARLLRCGFLDLDDAITRAAGLPVAEIFRQHGEPAFRVLEREAMDQALQGERHVVAAGGGWAAQPGNLERATPAALVIYLRCTPETAAGRLGEARGRPLLASDPLAAVREQLAGRQAFYERAHAVLDTDDQGASEVGAKIAALARSSGGW